MAENWVAAARADLERAATDAERRALLQGVLRDVISEPGLLHELVGVFARDPESESLAVLLESVLDGARMMRENGERPGQAILSAADEALRGMLSEREPGMAVRIALSRIHVRAGVPVPEALAMQEDEHGLIALDRDGMDLTAGRSPPDPETLISDLLDGADEPLQAHAATAELFGALPTGPRQMMVEMIAARAGTTSMRLGCYWLLDPDRDLAAAAARGLEKRLGVGHMDAAGLGDLVRLRAWLPDDAVRTHVDALIRQGLRAELSGGRAITAVKVHKTLASLPDGAGAQSIAASVQAGSRRVVAMVMLKRGHGVKDAFVIPCSSATEQRKMLTDATAEMAAVEVAPWYVPLALCSALGERLLPAPGLIDVVEALDLHEIVPHARSIEETLQEVDTHGMLGKTTPQRLTRLGNMCADAMDRYPMTRVWFENAVEFEDILSTPHASEKIERNLWRYMATRRSWWADQCAVAAATLSAAGETDWLGFAGTALLLDGRRDLKKIPLMHRILDRSVSGPVPEIDIDTIAHALGQDPDWLDGYLVAAAISPGSLGPIEWLEPLLGRFPEPPPMEVLQFILDALRDGFHDALDWVQDDEDVCDWFEDLTDEGLAAWCAGFQSFVTAAPKAWPKRGRRKLDKLALELIAEGREADRLRLILPDWITTLA